MGVAGSFVNFYHLKPTRRELAISSFYYVTYYIIVTLQYVLS